MLARLKNLDPLADDPSDAEVCAAMASILERSDIDAARLAHEIDLRLKKSLLARLIGRFWPYFDRKVDLAIEASAAALTDRVLNGGP